jgi:hypothetical protein
MDAPRSTVDRDRPPRPWLALEEPPFEEAFRVLWRDDRPEPRPERKAASDARRNGS